MITFNNTNYQRQYQRRLLNSEINMTPFIDVVLVLLIIFMVTSPLLISHVDINLPYSVINNPTQNISNQTIVLSIKRDNKIYIEDEFISLSHLLNKLQKIKATEKKTPTILLSGDSKVDYGRIMEVFTTLQKAGIQDISLLTQEIVKNKQ